MIALFLSTIDSALQSLIWETLKQLFENISQKCQATNFDLIWSIAFDIILNDS